MTAPNVDDRLRAALRARADAVARTDVPTPFTAPVEPPARWERPRHATVVWPSPPQRARRRHSGWGLVASVAAVVMGMTLVLTFTGLFVGGTPQQHHRIPAGGHTVATSPVATTPAPSSSASEIPTASGSGDMLPTAGSSSTTGSSSGPTGLPSTTGDSTDPSSSTGSTGGPSGP